MKYITFFTPEGRYQGYATYSQKELEVAPAGIFGLHAVGKYSDAHYHDGVDVRLLPPQPSDAHVFDYSLKTWIDPRTLDELRAAKAAEINAARLVANQSSFPFAGKQISCDVLSRSDIDGVNGEVASTGQMPANWVGHWKAQDNSIVPIPDVATWKALYSAMVAQGQSHFMKAQRLKSQLALARTKEEIQAIAWEAA